MNRPRPGTIIRYKRKQQHIAMVIQKGTGRPGQTAIALGGWPLGVPLFVDFTERYVDERLEIVWEPKG